jgi:hypothetical protein
VTVATITYSAYQDVSGVVAAVRGQAQGSPGTLQTKVSGNTAQWDLNFSVPNGGLYPLQLEMSCAPQTVLPVSCNDIRATVSPGQVQRISFIISVSSISGLKSAIANGASLHLNTTASASIEPFATLTASFDLGSVLSGGNL